MPQHRLSVRSFVLLAAALMVCSSFGVMISCGGGGGGAPTPPATPTINVAAFPTAMHIGTSVAFPVPSVTAGTVDSYSITPTLPAGMTFNSTTGALSGSPTSSVAATTFTLAATYGSASGHPSAPFTTTVATFALEVRDLPTGVEHIADGFVVERVLAGLNVPVRMAAAPDGRVFYAELQSGNIRTLNADLTLNPTPWASLTVVTGGERGLIGLALSPNFATDGYVYAVICVDTPTVKNQVVRLNEDSVSKLGGQATVIVDDLPQGAIGNGGEILFLADGTFLLSLGDNGVEDNAQDDLTLAGRILRFNADGSIPADNPNPASAEWVRGIRNTFGMTRNPFTNGVFATENGPAADDELNFIQPGRNFNWPSAPMGQTASEIGLTLRTWNEVIAPTGMLFARDPALGSSGGTSPTELALLIGGYVEAEVVRLVMSGASYADIDSEDILIRWENVGVSNKPLDLIEMADGSVLVSTFEGIWRLRRP